MIYALISLYNPTEKNIENIYSISQQVDKIFLCDNSSKNNNYLSNKIQNSKYIFFNENKGLSKAFNIVLKTYNFYDEDFIFFFDQDSVIHDDHIVMLLKEYDEISKNYNIGCVGPRFSNYTSGISKKARLSKKISQNHYIVPNIITSSSLFKFKTLKEINFWNESIFLDMADWDLCWRIRKKGKKCFITDAVHMEHKIGDGKKKILFFSLDLCKPFREYYIIRDGAKLLMYNYVEIRKKVMLLYIIFIRSLLNIFFLDKKCLRLKYIFIGFCHFLIYKKGALKIDE